MDLSRNLCLLLLGLCNRYKTLKNGEIMRSNTMLQIFETYTINQLYSRAIKFCNIREKWQFAKINLREKVHEEKKAKIIAAIKKK